MCLSSSSDWMISNRDWIVSLLQLLCNAREETWGQLFEYLVFVCVFLICHGWTESSLSLCLAQLEINEVSFGWIRFLLHIKMKHAPEICVIQYCACFLSYAFVRTCLVLGTDTLDHRPHSPIHTHSYCAPVRYTLVHSQLSGTTLRLIGKQSVAQFCP